MKKILFLLLFVVLFSFWAGSPVYADRGCYNRYQIEPVSPENTNAMAGHVIIDNDTGKIWILEITKMKNGGGYKSRLKSGGYLLTPDVDTRNEMVRKSGPVSQINLHPEKDVYNVPEDVIKDIESSSENIENVNKDAQAIKIKKNSD